MKTIVIPCFLVLWFLTLSDNSSELLSAETKAKWDWRPLPLIADGRIADPGDVVWFKEISVRPLPARLKPSDVGIRRGDLVKDNLGDPAVARIMGDSPAGDRF